MTAKVYFATNRAPSVAGEFASVINPNGRLSFGRALVRDIGDGDDGGPGNLMMDALTVGAFGPALVDAMCSEADHLLISLHGFGYDHRGSLARAAYLQHWFGIGAPQLESAVVAFCWPTSGAMDPFHYEIDYRTAIRSGEAFSAFWIELAALVRRFRAAGPGRRVTLMAHSMGNHLLRFGLEATFGAGRLDLAANAGLFDRILLIAGDEDAHAITAPNGLYTVLTLAQRTVVYFNRHDIALDISRDLHLVDRLGHVGAPDKRSFRGCPIAFVDCAPSERFAADPEGHQYYRTLPAVRDDICAEMAGVPPEAIGNRVYDAGTNCVALGLQPAGAHA